ncbi:hypothetical protein BsWGS_13603 [Bradybaena similaris]
MPEMCVYSRCKRNMHLHLACYEYYVFPFGMLGITHPFPLPIIGFRHPFPLSSSFQCLVSLPPSKAWLHSSLPSFQSLASLITSLLPKLGFTHHFPPSKAWLHSSLPSFQSLASLITSSFQSLASLITSLLPMIGFSHLFLLPMPGFTHLFLLSMPGFTHSFPLQMLGFTHPEAIIETSVTLKHGLWEVVVQRPKDIFQATHAKTDITEGLTVLGAEGPSVSECGTA